jgi:hypothetical protein
MFFFFNFETIINFIFIFLNDTLIHYMKNNVYIIYIDIANKLQDAPWNPIVRLFLADVGLNCLGIWCWA